MEALEPFPLVSDRIRKPTPLPPAGESPLRARLRETLPPREVAARRIDAPDALWVASDLVPRFLAFLEAAPPSVWEAFRIHMARGGIVARGPVPARRELAAGGLALAVPLHGGESRGGHALHIEHGALAPALRHLVEIDGDTLIRIDRGRVVPERIGPPVPAGALLRHSSTPVEALPWPGAGEPPPVDLRSRDAAATLFAGLDRGKKEDPELRRILEDAFGKRGARVVIEKPVPGQDAGWLRRFLPRKLDEALRKRLDAASRKRIADPVERARIIKKQRDALARLLQGLSGECWRTALSVALPLRAPGEVESDSTWLHAGEPESAIDTEFDLGRAMSMPRGVFGVGPRVHAQLEALYRRAGEALIASRDYRRAAHVFSYLLGDHSRAGAILEQGGFPREAATVYYHLADNPRRAAVALERGGLHDEAARIWMDLLLWPEAARAWKAAGDAAQARAAWRRVALDLEKGRRMLEAADVLEHELDEPEAARAVLERCAMACDPESIEALERCARAWSSVGEEERARGVFARARARFEWAASEGTGRAPLVLLADLAHRAAQWRADDPIRRAAGGDAARSTWVSAAAAWARARRRAPAALRREIDTRILRAAGAGPDRWLLPDAERWLRDGDPAGARPRRQRIDVEELRLPGRSTCLATHAGTLFLGLENGRIAILEEGMRPPRIVETGAAKPIVALASSRTDFYSATEDEVHHFSAAGGVPERPAHIERTLPFAIRSLTLFPGTGLLVIGSREARLLHPAHLAPLSHVALAEGDVVVDGRGNTRLAALLVRTDSSSIFEARVLVRREARGGVQLRTIERFPLLPGTWRGIGFLEPDGDDLVVVGDDVMVLYPSRRDRPRTIDLQVSSSGGELPRARVLAAPGRNALLVAYGDGSLERIDLAPEERDILLDGPENLDPLVGFACQGNWQGAAGSPWTAWILHASGLLRTARPAGDRTHT